MPCSLSRACIAYCLYLFFLFKSLHHYFFSNNHQSGMANRSYTVSFGALEISVNSNTQAEEECAPSTSTVKTNSRDTVLGRQLMKAQKRDSERRLVRDDAYWDKQHQGSVHHTPHEPKHVTSICSSLFQGSEKAPIEDFTHLLPAVQSVLETDAQRNGREEAVSLCGDDTKSCQVHVKDFFVRQRINSVPVLCWTCAHELSSLPGHLPKFLPFKFVPSSQYFMVCGYFCSWECARLHAISIGGSLHQVTLLATMLRRLYGRHIRLHPHCNRLSLKVFGGHVDIEAFRSSLHECNRINFSDRIKWHQTITNCLQIKPKRT